MAVPTLPLPIIEINDLPPWHYALSVLSCIIVLNWIFLASCVEANHYSPIVRAITEIRKRAARPVWASFFDLPNFNNS
jgi:hypothetical protein